MGELNMSFIPPEIERKLKPCKRCGSKAVEFHGEKPGDYPWIFCRNRGLLFGANIKGATPERVIREWNRSADNG